MAPAILALDQVSWHDFETGMVSSPWGPVKVGRRPLMRLLTSEGPPVPQEHSANKATPMEMGVTATS